MNWKKWLAMGMVLVLALGVVAGCTTDTGGGTGNGEEKPVLRVGLNAAFPPFEFRDENNKIVGFDVDLINAIGEIIGYEVELVDVAWEGIFAGLQSGMYDVICSGVTITEERAKSMEFSDPYFRAGQVIVVRQDYDGIQSEDDFPGKSLGVQISTTAHEVLLAMEEVAENDIKLYDNYPLAFIDLVNGGIDAVVVDMPVGKEEVARNDKVKLVSEEPYVEELTGIAIQKGNYELVENINTALAEIQESGLYDELYEKWFSQ